MHCELDECQEKGGGGGVKKKHHLNFNIIHGQNLILIKDYF